MEESGRRRVKNRRLDDDDDDVESMSMGWRVMYGMGMPMLYICALLLGIVGVICNGLITRQWSQLTPPLCYLYSTTPSMADTHRVFGGPLSGCQWVTYGGATALIFLVLSALVYFLMVRGRGKLNFAVYVLEVLSLLGSIFMLAVVCSLTEGLRQTCSSMALNQWNMRGEQCDALLNMRVMAYNLSVSSSTLIRGAMYTLWPTCVLMCVITFFHLCSCYRRCYR